MRIYCKYCGKKIDEEDSFHVLLFDRKGQIKDDYHTCEECYREFEEMREKEIQE